MPEPGRHRRRSVAHVLDEHRALLLLLALGGALTAFAPNFLSVPNLTAILKGACLNGIVAIGFTIVFILGQLDLSVGAVVMLSGMLVIGLQPHLGWPGAVAASILAGAAVGLANGLLVVRGRINSFIVTLGTMTIVTGLMHMYSHGGSKQLDDFRLADWLDTPVIPFLSPMVVLTLALVLGFTFFLNRTAWGRNFFVVGGNPETAWLAGVNRDRYLIGGFVLGGATAAAGGVLFAASLSSMTAAAVLGTRTLMTVLAAVIIGGTLMTGGRGSVFKSYLGVLLLTTLFNGIGCLGYGLEVQIFINGLILAVVVLYEAFVIYRHDLLKGQRPELMKELASGALAAPGAEEETEEEEEQMQKDRFALTCVTLVALVAIVAIFAMYFIRSRTPLAVAAAGAAVAEKKAASEVNVYELRGTDGQPYILPAAEKKQIPPRPADPKALLETDKGHWWDNEYAGWTVQKAPMPESPRDGPRGKKVILLKAGDHPYWTAYVRGFRTIATIYGVEVKIFNGNWNMDLQSQQTDQAINDKPDLIIFAPVDAMACTPLLRRIHKSGIPCITSNTIPCDEAMKYCLAWTGPDDWGQFRMLSRAFADAMGKKGGYAIVRHMPGSSPFFARTFAPITELKEYAPDMQMLDMDTSNLEAEKTMQLVAAWINKYGEKLKGLVLAGDEFTMTGSLEAMKKAGRTDIVIIAAGNSKTGMDAVKAGEALAVTYQSAEGDGALALYSAVEWFYGRALEPVRYLPKKVLTKDNVEQYMPAQW